MSHRIPDLDTWPSGRLMKFWLRYQQYQRRADAHELIGDKRKGYTTFARNLGAYAANLATAKCCQLEGDWNGFVTYSDIAWSIRMGLPKDLRIGWGTHADCE